jgi:putative endonuclease
MMISQKWFVYILKCSNGCFYTGITNDVARRFNEHKSGKGAKYTRAFRVKKIVYVEAASSRSAASKKEAEIKSWTRKEKKVYIRKYGSPGFSPRRDLCVAA